MFDARRTGSIPTSETGHLLHSLGQNPTQEELAKLIKKDRPLAAFDAVASLTARWLSQVDGDQSGSLEFDEFVDLMEETWKTKDEQLEELREAFLTFDQDNNGFITKEELIDTLLQLGDPIDQEVLDAMVAEADKDGDGEIDYGEFIGLMLNN